MESIRDIADSELAQRLLDAKKGAPEADLSEHYLMHELSRRTRLLGAMAYVEAAYDAQDDVYVNPSEAPQQWAYGALHDHMHYEGGRLVEDTPTLEGNE